MADAISSGSCPILFKVLTLNVAICIVCLHFSNCCLSSVANFRTLRLGLQPQQDVSLFYPHEEQCSLDIWFECGSWLTFRGCLYSHLQKPLS